MLDTEVNNREDFVKFVRTLRDDLEEGKHYWQNTTLDSFLEIMAHWVEERMPEYLERDGESMPNDDSWRQFARILDAAAMYE